MSIRVSVYVVVYVVCLIYIIYMYSTYIYTAAGSLFESYYIVFIYNVSLKNERLLKKVVLLSARV